MRTNSKMPPRWTPQGFTLKVGKSATGKGLFTLEEIPKGACIIEYIGRPLSEKEAEKEGKYHFEVARNKTIDGNIPANVARYINHSCAPNCEADGPTGRVFVRALRKIKAGEELFYNYGEEYFERHIKPNGCKCQKCMAKLKIKNRRS